MYECVGMDVGLGVQVCFNVGVGVSGDVRECGCGCEW
jgi:hypothetical protein